MTTTVSDRELARNWMDAWNEHADGGDEEALLMADNAIADRLALDLDETERGLTPHATSLIKAFVDANLA